MVPRAQTTTERLPADELLRRIHRTRRALSNMYAGLTREFDRPEGWTDSDAAALHFAIDHLRGAGSHLTYLSTRYPQERR